MNDWSQLAKVSGSGIPSQELARITPLLAGLEAAFRPLAQSLTPDVEPHPVLPEEEERA